MNREGLAATKLTETLVCLALDAHAIDRHAEHRREVGAHLIDVRRELRLFEDDGGVDVADREAFRVHHLDGPAQQVDARGALPLRIGVGEMAADVAGARGAEDRVGDGVAYRIGIRMSREASLKRNRDAAENERPALDETVKVVAHSGPARPRGPAAASDRFRQDEILGRRDFDIRRLALDDPHRVSCPLGQRGLIRATLPRTTIFLAQTPQAFRRDVLRDALRSTEDATDEAELAERAGHFVRVVEGEATNIKITTQEDIAVADAIAARRSDAERQPDAARSRPARTGRAGIGYDLHRLVAGRPLILGGVTIPFDRGLQGHSDADAVCHAIIDAILGAAGAGDIGRHFPDTDQAWRGASSIDLLRRAVEIVRGAGLEVGNVDATVIAERPKLGPFVEEMRANVAGALGVTPERVSIKGKTNEGVGEIGRGEAIAVHAIALVRST